MALGAAPASQPSADSIRTWYLQLADRDPEVRERARIDLMGIQRKDLPALEKVVAENRPVQPSQAAVLRDIVRHVYIAGEPYQAASSSSGFLGMRWENGEEGFWPDPPGVIVDERIPGFCAYRMLRPGDVIVGIEELPDVQFANRTDFTNAVQRFEAGETITFLVLRGGNVQKVPLRLDARPAAAVLGRAPELMIAFESERLTKADEYWSRAFAPLVEEQSLSALHP
jgi:hypothetical protein